MKYSKPIIIAGIGMFLAAIAFYIVLVKIPTDLASNIAHEINQTFNFTPQIRVNETIVIEQSTPIAELATVARDISVDYSWSHEWLGSTKTIALRGIFTAKAGFDLKQQFAIDIERYPLKVRASMPPPKILSMQMNSYNIIQDENGWWNRISDSDRESAVRELQRIAREKAEASGMTEEARSTIEQRIKEIAERNGALIEFRSLLEENVK